MFTEVTEKHEKIIIVCSGTSAKGFVPPDDATVIAVNGVIDWISRADYFFTLDPSRVNQARIANKREGVKYYAAFDRPLDGAYTLERVETPRMAIGGAYAGVAGLSNDKSKIHTGNSGYGALNFAYHMEPKKIVFVGLDATSHRVEGGRSQDLSHLPILFLTSCLKLEQAGIEVVNASPESRVTVFPKMTIPEAMGWLK